MRLIDADALMEKILEEESLAQKKVIDTPSRLPNGDFNPYAMRYATQYDERTSFKFMIADAPTIDAEPKRGRWKPRNEEAPMFSPYHCSECGTICRNIRDEYCYHCGARMDGDGNAA